MVLILSLNAAICSVRQEVFPDFMEPGQRLHSDTWLNTLKSVHGMTPHFWKIFF
jgi:hypothetical protein